MSVREPNPALGYKRDGGVRLDCVRYCRVQVLSCSAAMLSDATERDAHLEGYRDLADLREDWGAGDQPVWVMRFRLDVSHEPRFLSERVVAGKQSDYVEVPARGLRHEPEAVDEDTQTLITLRAAQRDRARFEQRREEIKALGFDARLASLVAEARARHIDIRSELRAIASWQDQGARERQLEQIARKLPSVAAIAI